MLGQSRFVNVVIQADLNSRFGCFLINISSAVKDVFIVSRGLVFEDDSFFSLPPIIKLVKANAIIMKLARILVPLNYARNPRFSHDPAVPIPQLPVLSLCDEFAEAPKDKYGFIKNQLVFFTSFQISVSYTAARLEAQ